MSVGLIVNGFVYQGWQSVSVRTSIEQLAGNFRVQYTAEATQDGGPLPIVEGDPVQVTLDDENVIDGYVDDANDRYDSRGSTSDIAGRSKTGQLVDCSAIKGSGQWRDAPLTRIAKDLCQPFGVSVVANVNPGKAFRRFSLQEGETVYESLARAARMRGLLLLTNSSGGLVFDRAGSRRTETVIERGVNVLEGSRMRSLRDRFSSYTMKTQASGDDDFNGASSAQIKRTIEDTQVGLHRPTILMAENEDSGRELKERVTWERNTRAGKARRLTYRVQGWRDNADKLWAPNVIAKVKDDRYDIDEELLVVSVALERSLGIGTTAVLELTSKKAFDIYDAPAPKPSGGGLYG
jgi:prophage tail gpP-like protein